MTLPESSSLGKKVSYVDQYQPSLLFPIDREVKRLEIGVNPQALPFFGEDLWTGYEVSWLNAKGKPQVAIAEFRIPAHSPFLIESKSFKLYLNSFNQTRFESWEAVTAVMQHDLSQAAGAAVDVELFTLQAYLLARPLQQLEAIALDEIDIEINSYHADPAFLATSTEIVNESLYSDLLKSNCLVTGQPDWGTIFIEYTGHKIDHEGLFRYIIGFRQHQEFHEQCVERIFMDICRQCKPQGLTVYARYTRRGGLDINPIRSSKLIAAPDHRLVRQ